ncbi:hydrolase [Erysipelothrix inopinata]|uniref:Hydrolase n=1 Tax=Erysipelothrix inopinata TaxID=225084 RepID=A0A7G9S0L6_9FIRM|nr:hydrolase [Erysipelothrix inopinata]QNN61391.1 hydrolase [Erysipelothrix inopinata]
MIPEYNGNLRKHIIKVPEAIEEASGIRVFGRLLKSFVFTTDVAIIRNCNADAVIAVYPFTPQPIITHSIITATDKPVFSGVGGGTTRGPRVIGLAVDAEQLGAMGVVVNAPTKNKVVKGMKMCLEIPIIITIVDEHEDIQARLDNGAAILNVSAASKTPQVVRQIREQFPDVPIMATGGPTNETVRETIEAGANAITFTPPTTAELFKSIMDGYRKA